MRSTARVRRARKWQCLDRHWPPSARVSRKWKPWSLPPEWHWPRPRPRMARILPFAVLDGSACGRRRCYPRSCTARRPPWRWIPPLLADGHDQMALDGWMLDQLAAGQAPMLRLYRWRRPTLSLGRHQQRLEAHWPALVQAGVIDLVRRPSGGRAVLHAGELTYALAWRPPSTRRQEAYALSCRWLQQVFAALNLPLQFGAVAATAAQRRASCFASGTAADLVHANGAKRIGSAQLWRGPALLQHGSILLQPPAALWQLVFNDPPPALPALPSGLEASSLERMLRRNAEQHLCDGPLMEEPLSAAEWQQARRHQPPPSPGPQPAGPSPGDTPPDAGPLPGSAPATSHPSAPEQRLPVPAAPGCRRGDPPG